MSLSLKLDGFSNICKKEQKASIGDIVIEAGRGSSMRSAMFNIGVKVAMIILSGTATFNIALAQKTGGTLYALHSAPNGDMSWA